MTDTINPSTEKWWGNSLTIQGALLSAASAMLPAVSAVVGIDGETLRLLGEQTFTVVQAVGGLAGMAMTVVGRARVGLPLVRRSVVIRV